LDKIKRAVLVTQHYWNSKRKAGFHQIADSLSRSGWDVLFFTAPISWLSVVRNDKRLKYPLREEACKIRVFENNVKSFVWFTPWHPANLRTELMNRISRILFGRYGNLPLGESEEYLRKADLVIFESGPGLLLWERIKKLNPTARMVYRVSDDLRLLKNHPLVLETEGKTAPEFDLISVPSKYIYDIFKGLPNLRHHPHGIKRNLFDKYYDSPYPLAKGPNVVFIGDSFFDRDFLERASHLLPDYYFHIIGPIKNLPGRKNILAYGELPFIDTIPYLKYADIGLQIRSYFKGAESLTDSLKMIQYSYCQLPIVAPDFLKGARKHAFYYIPGDNGSIKNALETALLYDRPKISTGDIISWDDLTIELTGKNS